jgi:ribonucleoside-diphosphate reductase beta chain
MVRAIFNNVDEFIDSIIQDEYVQNRAESILSEFNDSTNTLDIYAANETVKRLFGAGDADIREVTQDDLRKAIYKSAMVLNMFEGIRFFATFVTAWSFSEQPIKLFSGSSNIFKLIARDEMIHLDVFQKVLKVLRTDSTEGFTDVAASMEDEMYTLFEVAYKEERDWVDHLFSKGSPLIGMNAAILKEYMDYIFAIRMTNIGMDPKKLGLALGSNPLPWVDNYLDSSHIKSAPQEIESVNYVAAIDSSQDEDFDLDDL